MKTVHLLFAVGVMFVALGCDKYYPNSSDEVESLSFTISDFKDGGDDPVTKTSVGSDGKSFLWSAFDTVGIYPNKGAQVYFEMTSGEAASSATFDGGGWAFKASSMYYSYYPFIGNIYLDRNHIPVSYLGQKQIGTTATDHVGKYDFMYTPGSSSSSGKVGFHYEHLGSLIRLRCQLPAGTYTKMAVTAPTEAIVLGGDFDLMSSSPSIIATSKGKQVGIDLSGITVTENQEFTVYMMLAPVDLSGVEITVSALNSAKIEYQCKKTPSKAYEAGVTYGLGCTSWTQVPQSMGLIVEDWGDGGNIGGDAD